MSILEQTKREAARLLKIAKQYSNQDIIHVDNLSHARELMAELKGYSNWHVYAESTKRRDLVSGNTKVTTNLDMSNLKRYQYMLDTESTLVSFQHKPIDDIELYQHRKHVPVVVATTKNLISSSKTTIKHYPVLYSGTTGAGKSEALHQLAAKYLANAEPCIYVDLKSDIKGFFQFYSAHAQKPKDSSSIKLLHFNNAKSHGDLNGHSIDPINPLIGDERAFQLLFDTEIGTLLNKLCLEVHAQNKLVSPSNIVEMLNLQNLLKWLTDETSVFSKVRSDIQAYFNTIGLSLETEPGSTDYLACLYAHSICCYKALTTIEVLDRYPATFKMSPDTSFYEILLKRQSLYVMIPAFEKHLDMPILTSIILLQLNQATKRLTLKEPNNYWSNIIIDEMDGVPNDCLQYMCNTLSRSFNWTFGLYDLNYNYQNVNLLLSAARTYFFMRNECSGIPDYIKLKIFDTVENIPTMTTHNKDPIYNIKCYRGGEALALMPIDAWCSEYKMDKIKFDYTEIKLDSNVTLE